MSFVFLLVPHSYRLVKYLFLLKNKYTNLGVVKQEYLKRVFIDPLIWYQMSKCIMCACMHVHVGAYGCAAHTPTHTHSCSHVSVSHI